MENRELVAITEFSLIRKYFNENYTIGKLTTNNEYLCDVIEDKVRDLHDINNDGDFTDKGEGKIYGQTAIPYGRYEIKMVFWPKHNRLYAQLQNVPGYTGIFIHSGRTAKHTEGCLIPGENKLKGQVLYSPYWTEQVTNIVRKGLQKGEVWITIEK